VRWRAHDSPRLISRATLIPARENDFPAFCRTVVNQLPPSRIETRSSIAIQALIGRTISDRYRVDAIIAMGGIGAVYRGEHVHMQKEVAIKVLRPETDGFPELVTRFEREAIAGAHLDHPNVASATDFGRLEDGSYFLVLEHVPGVTLRDLMKRRRLSPGRAAQIARQIAAGLAACHRMGVLHRDLKPRNIMIDLDRDLVKLIDFGLARVPMQRPRGGTAAIEDEEPTRPEITLKGMVFGTVAYMAPETALGMDAVDERSDLYALGVILYEMLAGLHPFDTADPNELFMSQRATLPPPIAERSPGTQVPRALEALAMRLLAKNPAERYSSAAAVVDAIDRVALVSAPDFDATPITGAHSLSVLMPASEGALKQGDAAAAPARAGRPTWRARASWMIGLVATLLAAALTIRTMAQSPSPAKVIDTVTPIAPFAQSRALAAARRAKGELEAAAAARVRLVGARERRDWRTAVESITLLAEIDPLAFGDRNVAAAVAEVAARLAFENDADASVVFSALSDRAGASGLDILYDVASTRGGSKGARRANEILRQDDARARASPALRITLELRSARCQDKKELFERAATEGDQRTLLLLDRLRAPSFCATPGQCCYVGNRALDRAADSLKARLRM
jgi:serine/threonine-protein kinase